MNSRLVLIQSPSWPGFVEISHALVFVTGSKLAASPPERMIYLARFHVSSVVGPPIDGAGLLYFNSSEVRETMGRF
jgi:hypothetical protein